jgi:competence protein ComEA
VIFNFDKLNIASILKPVAESQYRKLVSNAIGFNLTRTVYMRKLLINSILVAALSSSSFFAIAADTKTLPTVQTVAMVEQSKVNINSADLDTLARELNGVGMAKARAIVEYRETHGAFASVDELLEVKGIGTAILQKNLNKLAVE